MVPDFVNRFAPGAGNAEEYRRERRVVFHLDFMHITVIKKTGK